MNLKLKKENNVWRVFQGENVCGEIVLNNLHVVCRVNLAKSIDLATKTEIILLAAHHSYTFVRKEDKTHSFPPFDGAVVTHHYDTFQHAYTSFMLMDFSFISEFLRSLSLEMHLSHLPRFGVQISTQELS